MQRATLEWYETLGRALIWGAGLVLLLSVIAAIAVVSSESSLPLSEDVQREGRGFAAIAGLGAGFAAAGILSGVGAILRLMVADRLERLDQPDPGDDEPGS
ncbi:MAG: hypothetical protein JJE23_04170 [Thermoleophilia bacterium]|jgi:hypothetical protein|nr:hypothetical protein [Thermoleophilia bacterium]